MGHLRTRRSLTALLGLSLAAAAVAAGAEDIRAKAANDFGTFSSHYPELTSPIQTDEFRHPAEIDMIDTLMSGNPGIKDLVDETKDRQTKVVAEKDQIYQLHGVQVGPSQFPTINQAATDAAKSLGLHNNFKVFVVNNAEIQSDIFGFVRHAHYGNSFSNFTILLNSGMVKAMTNDELKFIIGREMGHVKANHRFYTALAFAYQAKTGLIPRLFPEQKQVESKGFGGALSMFFGVAPAASRLSEFSADRAGAVAVGTREASVNALAKIARGDLEGTPGFDLNSFLHQADDATKDMAPKDVEELVAQQMFQPYMLMRVGETNRFASSEQYKLLLDRTTSNPFLLEAETLYNICSSLRHYGKRLEDFQKDPATARLDPIQRQVSVRDLAAKIDKRQKATAELEGIVLNQISAAGLVTPNSIFDDLLNTARRRTDSRPFASVLGKLHDQVQFAMTQPGTTDEQRQKLEAKKSAIEEVQKLVPVDQPRPASLTSDWVESADLPQMLNSSVATLRQAADSEGRDAFLARLDTLRPQLREVTIKTLLSFPAAQRAQLAHMIGDTNGQMAELVGEIQSAGTDAAALGVVFDKQFEHAKSLLKTVPLFVIRKALERVTGNDA